MCRFLAYLGPAIPIEQLLCKPPHSLLVQASNPREMDEARTNADGYGVGWFDPVKSTFPYIYKQTLPIWGDGNLPHLSRYVESGCWFGHVRSASPGLAVDRCNCQPFSSEGFSHASPLLYAHNGYVNDYRDTLYLPIRDSLEDDVSLQIHGTTDSEHIFGMILNQWCRLPELSLADAVESALHQFAGIAEAKGGVYFCANVLISDGKQIVAARYSREPPSLSLYYLKDDPHYRNAVIIASEPLFEGNWTPCPEQSMLLVNEDREVSTWGIS